MRRRIHLFPGIIFVLLGLNFTVVGVTIWVAVGDPSFAVEPDYDIKAANWQQTVDARAKARALGWTVEPVDTVVGAPLRLRVLGADGQPLKGASAEAVVFHHALAGLRREFPLVDLGDGRHVSVEPLDRAGKWHVRVSVVDGTNRYLTAFDIVVPKDDL